MCYDTQNPIFGTHVPRGRGGVCILWPTCLGQYVKRLELSSHRMVAIQLTVPENIIIVNVYMPAICTDSKIEYQECIDILTNFLEKYPGYTYVLCGDFNATLSPSRNNPHDRIFKEFVKNLALYHSTSSLDQPTFIQHSGLGKSHIDYILANKQNFLSITITDTNAAENTSAHFAVYSQFHVTMTSKHDNKPQISQKSTKLIWQKGDIGKYNDMLVKSLKGLVETPDNLNAKFQKNSTVTTKCNKSFNTIKTYQIPRSTLSNIPNHTVSY